MTEGQSLTEFVLIICVIVLSSIMGLTLLGENVNAVFADSSNKISKFDPFNTEGRVSNAKVSNIRTHNYYAQNSQPYIRDNAVIGNYPVDKLSDGSTRFYVKDREIILSAKNLEIIDNVFQATGSSGDLIDVVSYMLEMHPEELQDKATPIEINFGTGTRYAQNGMNYSASYQGEVQINTIALQVGSHLILIQKDQNVDINHDIEINSNANINENSIINYNDPTTIDILKQSQGLKVIEGVITEQNLFRGTVIADDDPLLNGVKIDARITKTPNGYHLEDNNFHFNKEKNIDNLYGKWEFDFQLANETILTI